MWQCSDFFARIIDRLCKNENVHRTTARQRHTPIPYYYLIIDHARSRTRAVFQVRQVGVEVGLRFRKKTIYGVDLLTTLETHIRNKIYTELDLPTI